MRTLMLVLYLLMHLLQKETIVQDFEVCVLGPLFQAFPRIH